MDTIRTVLCMAVILTGIGAAWPASPSLIELSDGSQTWRGRLECADDRNCCLIEQDGQLRRLKAGSLKHFKHVADHFRGLTAAQLRDRLLMSLGGTTRFAGHRITWSVQLTAAANGMRNCSNRSIEFSITDSRHEVSGSGNRIFRSLPSSFLTTSDLPATAQPTESSHPAV